MTHPSEKKIGDLVISVDHRGWPRWTRITINNKQMFCFNEDQAHDLHYALCRIVAFLEDAQKTDRLNGIVA